MGMTAICVENWRLFMNIYGRCNDWSLNKKKSKNEGASMFPVWISKRVMSQFRTLVCRCQIKVRPVILLIFAPIVISLQHCFFFVIISLVSISDFIYVAHIFNYAVSLVGIYPKVITRPWSESSIPRLAYARH